MGEENFFKIIASALKKGAFKYYDRPFFSFFNFSIGFFPPLWYKLTLNE